MPLTEEPGLYKRPCPRSPSHCVHHEYFVWRSVLATFAVSVENELSRLLPPAPPSPLTFSLYFPFLRRLLQSPAAVTRQPRAVGPVRHFRLTLHKTDPPQDR